MTLDRRGFLKGALAGAGLATMGTRADAFVNIALPSTERTLDTIVVVMMENRSVDHYFHWVPQLVPGFDAVRDRTYVDAAGAAHPTEDWGGAGRNDHAGCDFTDPGHGWDSGRVQATDSDGDGEPDGFLREGSGNDVFALSHYGPADLPVYDQLVRSFTVFDRYFCSIMASTYPNRYYMHSAQTGGMRNNDFPPQAGKPTGWEWPTIWTALDQAGVSGAYYFSNLPALGLWGPRHLDKARHISNFYADAAAGQLPRVCFVDPWFVAPNGIANDDHPHADIRLGQEFLSGVVTSFIRSPHWEHGALFINYDEWGGFWDHVMPPTVPDPRAAEGYDQLGFRTPTVLVSPFARGPRKDSHVYDHTSILKMIETHFGLTSLQKLDPMARDAGNRNIVKAFRGFKEFDPEVDVDALTYLAPPEARIPCELRGHTAPPSDLYALAENGWLESVGWRLDWKFEDSLPW